MKEKLHGEKGAVVVVEAAIVFPITFFIIIVFILFGNLLYQQSRVDAIVARAALYMGNVFTDPVLIGSEGSIPNETKETNIQPYRFLLGASSAEDATEKFIKKELENLDTGLFSDMDVKNTQITCNLKNCIVYQQAEIEVKYSVWLPMSFFGMEPNIKMSSATTVAVTCPEEFIRNIDMIDDYLELTGAKDAIAEKWTALQTHIGAFLHS